MLAERTDQIRFIAVLVVVGILIAVGSVYIGQQPDVYTPTSTNQLWYLVKFGNTEAARNISDWALIDVEIHSWFTDLRGMYGLGEKACECYSLLGYAVYQGESEIAQILIDAGADPNGIEYDDVKFPPPLFWAVAGGHPGMVEILLENGADPQSTSSGHSLSEWHRNTLHQGHARYDLYLLVTGQWPPESPPEGWRRIRLMNFAFAVPSEMRCGFDQWTLGQRSLQNKCKGDSIYLHLEYWVEPTIKVRSGEPITFQGIEGSRNVQRVFDDEKGWYNVISLELYPPFVTEPKEKHYPRKIKFVAECYTEEAVETAEKIFDTFRFPW